MPTNYFKCNLKISHHINSFNAILEVISYYFPLLMDEKSRLIWNIIQTWNETFPNIRLHCWKNWSTFKDHFKQISNIDHSYSFVRSRKIHKKSNAQYYSEDTLYGYFLSRTWEVLRTTGRCHKRARRNEEQSEVVIGRLGFRK